MNDSALRFVTEQLASGRALVEEYITETKDLRSSGVPDKLFEAMEYSLCAGGKRIRPILCIAAAKKCGLPERSALPMALGLEMLHTATLIHDDLPCMDNDDMRRGKPSNHALFGETLAVLAGDALLAQALEFPMFHTEGVPAANLLRALGIFTAAVGPSGVCGGQTLDMFKDAEPGCGARRIASLKTGALIRAAVLTGAALAGAGGDIFAACDEYAVHLGAAFQIVDDILDSTSTAEELGKTPGKDVLQDKITYVSQYGVDRARVLAREESAAASAAIRDFFGNDDFLVLLPEFLVHRSN